MQTNST
jgi:hypothetical protein